MFATSTKGEPRAAAGELHGPTTSATDVPRVFVTSANGEPRAATGELRAPSASATDEPHALAGSATDKPRVTAAPDTEEHVRVLHATPTDTEPQ
ncbi:MAG TPA: hypothetical protein VGJ28_00985 [Micromonosporaceae bacterium]